MENKYKVLSLAFCTAAFAFGWHMHGWLHTCPVVDP